MEVEIFGGLDGGDDGFDVLEEREVWVLVVYFSFPVVYHSNPNSQTPLESQYKETK